MPATPPPSVVSPTRSSTTATSPSPVAGPSAILLTTTSSAVAHISFATKRPRVYQGREVERNKFLQIYSNLWLVSRRLLVHTCGNHARSVGSFTGPKWGWAVGSELSGAQHFHLAWVCSWTKGSPFFAPAALLAPSVAPTPCLPLAVTAPCQPRHAHSPAVCRGPTRSPELEGRAGFRLISGAAAAEAPPTGDTAPHASLRPVSTPRSSLTSSIARSSSRNTPLAPRTLPDASL
mmetsp:Transcript_17651/g.42051  ORF Transcript_17651/g.42051 Transcript_17651/m.42051 type:complete len:234 (+) Transcript_17651:1342-2043(+)